MARSGWNTVLWSPSTGRDLLPNEAHEFNGVADLLTDGHGIRAHVALLPEPGGGYTAGILQPPFFGGCLSPGEVMRSLMVFA